jgi:Zn-dependent protease
MAPQAQQDRREIRWCAISIGSCIKNIDIRLHWSFLFVILLLLLSAWSWNSSSLALLYVLAFGPFLVPTVLFHEAAHAFVTLRYGGEVKSLVLWPFGGLTVTGPLNKGIKEDLKAAIAGPLTHLILMVIWFCAYMALKGPDRPGITSHRGDSFQDYIYDIESGPTGFWCAGFRIGFLGNFYLFIMNTFLPVHPFDGGRILANILMLAGCSLTRAVYIVSTLGITAGLAACIGAIAMIFNTQKGLDLLLVGTFILFVSMSLFDRVKRGNLRHDLVFGRSIYDERDDNDDDGTVSTERDATTEGVEIPESTGGANTTTSATNDDTTPPTNPENQLV